MVLDAPSLTLLSSPSLSSLSSPSSSTISDLDDIEKTRAGGGGDGGEERGGGRGLGDLRISGLLRMVLQDAQTRLVFKAQSVMQSEIRWYVPKADQGDLDWPGCLERGRERARVRRSGDGDGEKEEDDGEGDVAGGGAEAGTGTGTGTGALSRILTRGGGGVDGKDDIGETWYPTVRKTVWVLEQLFDYVQVTNVHSPSAYNEPNLNP